MKISAGLLAGKTTAQIAQDTCIDKFAVLATAKKVSLEEANRTTDKAYIIPEEAIRSSDKAYIIPEEAIRSSDEAFFDQDPSKDHSILFEYDKSPNSRTGIISAFVTDDNHLGYKFAIPKPKEVLFIVDNETKFYKQFGNKLNENFEVDVEAKKTLLNKCGIYCTVKIDYNDLDYKMVAFYTDDVNPVTNCNECGRKDKMIQEHLLKTIVCCLKKPDTRKKHCDEALTDLELFPGRIFLVSEIDYPEPRNDKAIKLRKKIVLVKKEKFDSMFRKCNPDESDQILDHLRSEWFYHLAKQFNLHGTRRLLSEKLPNIIPVLTQGSQATDKSAIYPIFFEVFARSFWEEHIENNADISVAKWLGRFRNNMNSINNSGNHSEAYGKIMSGDDLKELRLNSNVLDSFLCRCNSIYNLFYSDISDVPTLPKFFHESNIASINKDDNTVVDDNSVNENNNNIYFTRHGEPRDDCLYSEAVSGSQYSFTLLEEYIKEKNNRQLQQPIYEAALLDLVIVDERVGNYFNKSPLLKRRIENMRMHVFDDIIGFLEHLKQDNINKDVVIVHQGLIDKIGKKKTELDNILDEFPFVFITSGRGRPDKIDANRKFIAFSNIEGLIINDYPDKRLLMGIILGATDKKSKER